MVVRMLFMLMVMSVVIVSLVTFGAGRTVLMLFRSVFGRTARHEYAVAYRSRTYDMFHD